MKYYVENPNVDREKFPRSSCPLIRVEITQLDHPVVTKTGEMGLGVGVRIYGKNTRYSGHAVCIPGDKFSLLTGGKIALKRALTKSSYKKKTRTSIWNGFLQLMGDVG